MSSINTRYQAYEQAGPLLAGALSKEIFEQVGEPYNLRLLSKAYRRHFQPPCSEPAKQIENGNEQETQETQEQAPSSSFICPKTPNLPPLKTKQGYRCCFPTTLQTTKQIADLIGYLSSSNRQLEIDIQDILIVVSLIASFYSIRPTADQQSVEFVENKSQLYSQTISISQDTRRIKPWVIELPNYGITVGLSTVELISLLSTIVIRKRKILDSLSLQMEIRKPEHRTHLPWHYDFKYSADSVLNLNEIWEGGFHEEYYESEISEEEAEEEEEPTPEFEAETEEEQVIASNKRRRVR